MILVTEKHFDYIITGGGCAGLSLVYHLMQTPLKNKKILLIEKDVKRHNDRTWCFWEQEKNPFESLVYHRWQQMYFYSHDFAKKLNLSPFTYKMIRGIDFYQHINQQLAAHKNITHLQASVEHIRTMPDGALVKAGGQTYQGDWVFNSIRFAGDEKPSKADQHLLQHFKGWVVKTEQPFFNPEEAVLMDFRVEQHHDCRFVYVLPTDAHTALVEYTIFSEELLSTDAYDVALTNYLEHFLSLRNYHVVHKEFGVIPMTDRPFAAQQSPHIINIGTAGGLTKPSTGYTFLRIQKDTQALVQAMVSQGKPVRSQQKWHKRFDIYDSTLLQVMGRRLYSPEGVFTHLFKNNPEERVLRFLDEATSFWEEVKVAHSVPVSPFMQGMLYAFFRRIF